MAALDSVASRLRLPLGAIVFGGHEPRRRSAFSTGSRFSILRGSSRDHGGHRSRSFGADVIKIEVPGKGDDTRAWGPPYLKLPDGSDDSLESAYYLSCNRNKRSAAINLASKDGADVVRRLAANADILVENFKVDGLNTLSTMTA